MRKLKSQRKEASSAELTNNTSNLSAKSSLCKKKRRTTKWLRSTCRIHLLVVDWSWLMLLVLNVKVRRRSLTHKTFTTKCFFGMEVASQTLSESLVKVWESRHLRLPRPVIFSARVCILLTSLANQHPTADPSFQMASLHLFFVRSHSVIKSCSKDLTVMQTIYPLAIILPKLKVAFTLTLLAIKLYLKML